MNQPMYDALETCLQGLEHGESLETLLARYPDLAEELRPLLQTAVYARTAHTDRLPVGALTRSRGRGLALAADLRRKPVSRFLRGHFRRSFLTAVSVIIILVMSGNGLLLASAHSLPGDPLYPLKRSVETTQLNWSVDPAQKSALQSVFSQRRVDEAKTLITIHRVESVEFNGVLTDQSNGQWVVSGIPVVVDPQTQVENGIGVGDEIQVSGSTNQDGEVNAVHLAPAQGPHEDDGQTRPQSTWTRSPGGSSDDGERRPTSTASAGFTPNPSQSEYEGGTQSSQFTPTPAGTRSSDRSGPTPHETDESGGGDH
ncbi:MAG TPA: DUF5666 domain-containing protein [Anaerolineales bacterium]|nr:DUF5666 domain-containing protein [Anaerolineales bacterium]